MGSQDSKQSQGQDDFFLLEHLSKISLNNRKTVSYYLISSQNGPNLSQLRQYFKIESFPSVSTLKQEMSFVNRFEIVKVIVAEKLPGSDVEYLQSEDKLAQVIGYNVDINGAKTRGMARDTPELIKLLNDLEAKDNLNLPANNVLFTIDQDAKMLNRYRLGYHCNTMYRDRVVAKTDFLALARKLYPEQGTQIKQFEQKYDLSLKGSEKHKMVVDWAFKNNFYWNMVTTVTRNTTDPKRLAYLRLGVKDMYEAIKQEYKSNSYYQSSYIVVDMTDEQKQKLGKEFSIESYMLFTTFVKGTTNEKQTLMELKKRPNAFRFNVGYHRSEKADDGALDFGFIKRGEQVLYNIYNVFKIEKDQNLKIRRLEATYRVLPVLDQKRKTEQARQFMSKEELDLTRNYDFYEDFVSRVDGQATLLQVSGYYQESLDIYEKKVDFIRKTNQSEDTMNRCLIRKGDALVLSGDYKAAEKTYRFVNTTQLTIRVIALIHLADMYLRTGEEEKLDSTITDLDPILSVLEKDPKEKGEYLKGRYFMALKSLKRGSVKKAKDLLKKLQIQITATYNHSMEGKPLYHDVRRTMAACDFKLGFPNDALNNLNQTLQWQLSCEGKTHNVALTQNLIQTVSRTSGDKQTLAKSMQRLQAMSGDIDSYQNRLSPSSVSNLNSSIVGIQM